MNTYVCCPNCNAELSISVATPPKRGCPHCGGTQSGHHVPTVPGVCRVEPLAGKRDEFLKSLDKALNDHLEKADMDFMAEFAKEWSADGYE